MLNYLKAELYKAWRQKALGVTLALLLLGSTLLLVLLAGTGTKWSFHQSVVLLYGMFPLGFLLIFPLGSLVFSEQYKYKTLKNELSFGIPRTRIYLGKLLVSALVCWMVCLILIAFFLGISWLLFPLKPGEVLDVELSLLGYCLLAALPVWLGALGLLNALHFTVKSTTATAVLYIAFFLVVEPMFQLFSELSDPLKNTFFPTIHMGMLSAPLGQLTGSLTPVLGWAWLVGMCWLAATSGIGLIAFQKADIK